MKNTQNNIRLEECHKLFDDTYLGVFNNCLAIAKVNKKGEIVKLTTFGEGKKEGDESLRAE